MSLSENVSNNALFVCFGCMSNVGRITGLAGLEAIRRVGLETAGIFCLGALATRATPVLEKMKHVKRIITVDGCPLNCARKIVENAGYQPDTTINVVSDLGIAKGPPLNYSDEDVQETADAIVRATRQPSIHKES